VAIIPVKPIAKALGKMLTRALKLKQSLLLILLLSQLILLIFLKMKLRHGMAPRMTFLLLLRLSAIRQVSVFLLIRINILTGQSTLT
jgi:hypothetical protein